MDLFQAPLKHFHMERQAEELTLNTWSLPSNAEQKMDGRAAEIRYHRSLVALLGLQGWRGGHVARSAPRFQIPH